MSDIWAWPPPPSRKPMEEECSVCGEEILDRGFHIGNGERVCRHTCLADYLADRFPEEFGSKSYKEDDAEAKKAQDEGWVIEAYVTVFDPAGEEVYSFFLDEDCLPVTEFLRAVRANRFLARGSR